MRCGTLFNQKKGLDLESIRPLFEKVYSLGGRSEGRSNLYKVVRQGQTPISPLFHRCLGGVLKGLAQRATYGWESLYNRPRAGQRQYPSLLSQNDPKNECGV